MTNAELSRANIEQKKQASDQRPPFNQIICGDCREVMTQLPKAAMVFADPPDNLGLKYDGYKDKKSAGEYIQDMTGWLSAAMEQAPIVWFSIYHRWLADVFGQLVFWKGKNLLDDWSFKLFIWRFTFGQHSDSDCGNGFRPIIRMTKKDARLYPDAIREPSKRQIIYNDKRANPAGRVPDDVWDFSRVCGTFIERRKWHPTQHPEALIERIVKFSTMPGDIVIDMFAGTGTVNRVCEKLNRNCYGIEISRYYCEQILKEQKDKQNLLKNFLSAMTK
jgi:site-specific DNA-methyltransferase (adenine-specific)